jgi:hypothetical protein
MPGVPDILAVIGRGDEVCRSAACNIRGTMTDPHAKALARLEERLRTSHGELAPAARAAATDMGPLQDPLAQRYVETLRQHAHKLTERRVAELARAGWTDGQVFELTIAAAFGAAKRRLDAGLAALGETAELRPPAEEG